MNVDPSEVCEQTREAIAKAQVFSGGILPIITAINACPKEDFIAACFYPEQAMVIVTLSTRDGFSALRSLARLWEKTVPVQHERKIESEGDLVWYDANIGGIDVQARICELPPSCKVEYIEEQVPAHTRRVAKVTCDNGVSNE